MELRERWRACNCKRGQVLTDIKRCQIGQELMGSMKVLPMGEGAGPGIVEQTGSTNTIDQEIAAATRKSRYIGMPRLAKAGFSNPGTCMGIHNTHEAES